MKIAGKIALYTLLSIRSVTIPIAVLVTSSWLCNDYIGKSAGMRYTPREELEYLLANGKCQVENSYREIYYAERILTHSTPPIPVDDLEIRTYARTIEFIHPDITLTHALHMEDAGGVAKLWNAGYTLVVLRGDDRYAYVRD